jgi:hypothetical protein
MVKIELVNPDQQYFAVHDSSIKCLLANNANTAQILAFLIVARCKFGYDNHSASYTALRRRLGIGTRIAKDLLSWLSGVEYNGVMLMEQSVPTLLRFSKVFESEDEYTSFVEETKHFRKGLKRVRRWKLSAGDVKALFNHSFVDNNAQRLRSIVRHNNDKAMKLLLLLHLSNNITLDLVDPEMLNVRYKVDYLFSEEGLAFFSAKSANELKMEPIYAKWLYNTDSVDIEESRRKIYRLLSDLESYGLVKRVVTVLAYDSEQAKTPCSFYEIDIKTSTYAEKHQCHTLATALRKVALDRGINCGRNDDRFYDEYVVAAPDSKDVWVCGAYRLTYGMRTITNKFVAEGIETKMLSAKRIHEAVTNILNSELGKKHNYYV